MNTERASERASESESEREIQYQFGYSGGIGLAVIHPPFAYCTGSQAPAVYLEDQEGWTSVSQSSLAHVGVAPLDHTLT